MPPFLYDVLFLELVNFHIFKPGYQAHMLVDSCHVGPLDTGGWLVSKMDSGKLFSLLPALLLLWGIDHPLRHLPSP